MSVAARVDLPSMMMFGVSIRPDPPDIMQEQANTSEVLGAHALAMSDGAVRTKEAMEAHTAAFDTFKVATESTLGNHSAELSGIKEEHAEKVKTISEESTAMAATLKEALATQGAEHEKLLEAQKTDASAALEARDLNAFEKANNRETCGGMPKSGCHKPELGRDESHPRRFQAVLGKRSPAAGPMPLEPEPCPK